MSVNPKRNPLFRLLLRRRLLQILQTADPAKLEASAFAQRLTDASLASLQKLQQKTALSIQKLHRIGKLSAESYQGWLDWLSAFSPEALAEQLSLYHAPLKEKEFYNRSDQRTRRSLRLGLERFARRHRLPPSSAALLWEGENPPPQKKTALLLLLPIPMAATLTALLSPSLSLTAVLLSLLTLPALTAGGLIAITALLAKWLPQRELPVLEHCPDQTILTICVGRTDAADQAFQTLARIMADGAGRDCLLLLALPDASTPQTAEDAVLIPSLELRAKALGRSADLSVDLQILPRRYATGRFLKKRYRGTPDLATLAEVILRQIERADTAPDAVCILPADGIPLPCGISKLSSALFHPLCPYPILTFRSPTASALPHRRLQTARQALLQGWNAPADLVGWGIYRTDALRQAAVGKLPAAGLSAEPLYRLSDGAPPLLPDPIRQAPTLLPFWRLSLPLSRILLQVALVWVHPPLSIILLLWGMASADLLISALLSLRPGRRFFLHTLPDWRKLALRFLRRTLLPVQSLLPAYGNRSYEKLCLCSLLAGSLMIAFGSPLAFWGLIVCIAPLLQGELRSLKEGSARHKAACHALAKELLPRISVTAKSLPPAYFSRDPQAAPYSTPSAMVFSMLATISACDLGLIDPYTLERRIAPLLEAIESLPMRCGLPYARYHRETGDFYENGRVDTTEVGLFALGLAVIEAGLHHHLPLNPALLGLADKCLRIAEKMDFSILFSADGQLCQTLTPEGTKEGRLSHLFGDGPAWFAALASAQGESAAAQNPAALWESLLWEIRFQRGHCILTSQQGRLSDYLLPAFLLPAPADSLVREGANRGVALFLRQARGGWLLRMKRRFCSSREERDFPTRLIELCRSPADALQLPPATALCLLLPMRPRMALSALKALHQTDATGAYSSLAHSDQIPTLGISLAMIALAGVVTEQTFSSRLASIPRYGRLLPLLYRTADQWRPSAPPHPADADSAVSAAYSPSVCLTGDAERGLLIARGESIALWHKGSLLTAPVSVGKIWSGGRPSGILLMQEGKLLPLPHTLSPKSGARLQFSDEAGTCRISDAPGGWCIQWEKCGNFPIDARFVYCPASAVRLTHGTFEGGDRGKGIFLSMEYSAHLTVTVAMSGILNPFLHADSAPLPRGKRQRASIFQIAPNEATGQFSTPTCIIGGQTATSALQIRILLTATPSAAMTLLQQPSQALPLAEAALLPLPDGRLASKVLEWQITPLFAGAPVPAAMAVGSLGSDRAQLERCLEEGSRQLAQKGFPCSDDSPIPLIVSRREGAEALLSRLLAVNFVDAETPLLPPTGRIAYPDGFLQIRRGRDLPPLSHSYRNGIARLTVSEEEIRYRPYPTARELTLELYLEQDHRTLLLPAASRQMTFAPAEAQCIGDGFDLRIALLPRLPLLALYLSGGGRLTVSSEAFPPVYKGDAEETLYSLSDGKMLFLRRISGDGQSALLIGSFPKARDHLYYWIQNAITLRSLPPILKGYGNRLRAQSSLLQMQGEHALPLPFLAATALASDTPARALLTPLCTPTQGIAELIRLARSPASLFFPMALALWVSVTGDTTAPTLRIPTKEGRASLYLLAARCLETVMENDPYQPLLPAVVSAFAGLAERMGDHSGKALYAAYTPPEASAPWQSATLPNASPAVVTLLSDLYHGRIGATPKLLTAIAELPLSPSPTDAALLWSGMLWGALGFRPSALGKGFTLAPLPTEQPLCCILTYQGCRKLTLSPDAPPLCAPLADGTSRQKMLRSRKFSLQNSCIIHKNSVK